LLHVAAPALILGYAAMAHLSRMSRSFMLEQLRQGYVLTAKAKVWDSERSSGDTRFVTSACSCRRSWL